MAETVLLPDQRASFRERARSMEEPLLVFAPEPPALPALELYVNFGVFAGRDVTPAEIDELAAELLGKVSRVSIVSEHRYEIGPDAEAAVHQLRIQVEAGALEHDRVDLAELRGRLLEVTDRWAEACVAERSQETSGSR